jgi:ABC-type nitrate/sulfonate/bicarbonate transport system ATPase subunit
MVPIISQRLCDEGEIQTRAEHLLKEVGVHPFAEFFPDALSSGMKQRVVIARAFAARPDILLLDEPFSALDSFSKEVLYAAFLRLVTSHDITSIMVTHDLDEAVTLADRVVIISNGAIGRDYAINLPRPRVVDGIRIDGFEKCRNQIMRASRQALKDVSHI